MQLGEGRHGEAINARPTSQTAHLSWDLSGRRLQSRRRAASGTLSGRPIHDHSPTEHTMTAHDVLRLSIGMGEFVCMGYLADLSDEDFMRRAAPGVNHINWQVGHLILADYNHVNDILPGTLPPLPEGFAQAYSKDNAASDDPQRFFRKEALLAVFREQRPALLAALASVPASDLDRPAPPQYQEYAPNWGALFELAGSHWLMHCGQWVVVRRQLGKKALY
jgi:hypothetical protein